MKRSQVCFYLVLPCLIGCSPSAPSPSKQLFFTPSDEIRAGLGEQITLELPANPSTGYSWRIVGTMPSLLRSVAREYEPGQNTGNIVGAGGTEIWTFQAHETGQADMTMEYVRPWETDTPAALTRTFRITVQ